MRVVVAGAGGRMGRALVGTVAAQEGMRLVAALDRPGADCQGQDAGLLAGIGELGIAIADDPLPALADCDALLDFTAPQATVAHAELAAQARIVHVIGTTGLSPADDEKLRAAARHARIVRSGNMSLGVNLLAGLVRRASATLGPEFDIEILEMHHRHKVDAPSGTALRMGEAAAKVLDRDLEQCAVYGREGQTGERERKTIGFATVRGGDIVGDHTVLFAGLGERLEVTHKASSRMTFAKGAVRAANWLMSVPAGRLYDMEDVLDLRSA